MRIVAGTMRGLRLAEVGKSDAAVHLRPTSDRVRESLFNILTSGRFGDPVTDARVLDLFAGTGALGFEALSRGAAHVNFVENGKAAHKLIAENTRLTRSSQAVTLIRQDATKLAPNPGEPCTLIFLDPPYGKQLGIAALLAAVAGGWLAPGAMVVIEENAPQMPPPGFALLDTRRYGDTHITLMRKGLDDAT